MKHSVVMPVKINEPSWQVPMTHCAIETLRATTKLEFELVIVEYQGERFADVLSDYKYKHINIEEPLGPNAEANIGIDFAQGEYIVYTGNDVF